MSLFIGIDWADEDHDIITNEVGQSLDAFAIEDSLTGLEMFQNRVKAFETSNSEIHIAIETPHGLLIRALIDQHYQVYPINPKAVKRSRETHRVSGAKDDKFDAFVLAHLLRTHLTSFRLSSEIFLDCENYAVSAVVQGLVHP